MSATGGVAPAVADADEDAAEVGAAKTGASVVGFPFLRLFVDGVSGDSSESEASSDKFLFPFFAPDDISPTMRSAVIFLTWSKTRLETVSCIDFSVGRGFLMNFDFPFGFVIFEFFPVTFARESVSTGQVFDLFALSSRLGEASEAAQISRGTRC